MNNPSPVVVLRRAVLAAGVDVILAPVLSGCDWLSDQPVAVAAHVWVGYEPMFLARERAWLNDSQVQLLRTRSASESISALRSGKVQAAALTLDEVLTARASGLALTVVLVFNVSMGADMLVARSPFKRLADLKGRRIGYEASSVGEVMLYEVLKAANLSRQDVSLVKLPVDQQLEAWQHQFLDAVITYEPVASQLLATGAVRLFDSRQIPGTIVDVLAVHHDALDRAHTSALRHLIAGHFRALDHLLRSPQDAAYRMAPHLNLPASAVLLAYKGLMLPTAVSNYRLLAGAQPELLATARMVMPILVDNGAIKQADTLVNLIRADYLPTDALSR
jgi:NitT/TauT family transport system substrate-binding protein